MSVENVKAHANGRNKPQHCCVLLGVLGQQCCVHLYGPKSLTGFKLYTTSANIVVFPGKRAQHVGLKTCYVVHTKHMFYIFQ